MFLVITYNRSSGHASVQEFGSSEREAAHARRAELERAQAVDPDTEVVLLSGRTIEDIKQTHARYFESYRELVSDPGWRSARQPAARRMLGHRL